MNSPFNSILIATRNPGKLVEVVSILEGLPFRLLSLADFKRVGAVEESGQTFADNAARKAQGYAKQTGHLSLAEDSGLEVDELGGAPGALSARFAGEAANDPERVAFLLSCLEFVPEEKRTGRFRCVVAVADSKGNLMHLANGRCEGRIAFHPQGSHGFGYDPVFIPNGYNLTFAEMGICLKNQLSHRAIALATMRQFLSDLVNQS
jgi:XTP/dITP diphosphohydrolase